ncbi:hypothetical protein BZM27_52870 [Paraburkholderia steynii]|uniref:HTH araC/xylS-type domain-containing protein n=1 Tax=Paraburkholderia steynii TaxID=1245441 RepID=A0A4R0WZ60_9BURK|nr:hypothetical protein BZM27_52870 [Paraburkholderia steynii]
MARKVSQGSPLVSMAANLVQDTMLAVDMSPQIECKLSAATLDVWATMLEAELASNQLTNPLFASALEEVRHYMTIHIEDSEMNIEAIARSQHMSVRTLIRLFALDGETPMRWLWKKSLAVIYRLLVQRRVSCVSEAAISCGFSDMAHFSRAFKNAFGRTPRQILKGEADASCRTVSDPVLLR